ncbi:MAG: hypothetical protein IT301_01555 [Dehalococcoidia bacterium]|nr:hypothetical protein [Dehalococcoidia bacterium]
MNNSNPRIPNRRRWSPDRGGHAPGHIRERFTGWLEADQPEQFEDQEERMLTRDQILGQLWNCTDILESGWCHELDIPAGSTYAMAVRSLKARAVH